METLYGLKRKTTNRWLKLLLLLFVAVGFGVPNLNAQTKAIKVANNQQLIEAMSNHSIRTIVFEEGYYPYLNYYAKSGTTLKKAEGGNRVLDCQYFIYDANICVSQADLLINPQTPIPIPPGAYYYGDAVAGWSDPNSCGCCPSDDMGSWEWVKSASTYLAGVDTLIFAEALNNQDMDFYVTGPGVYSLKYSWGPPWNSYVQTEYVYRGPSNVELSAPDVCGLVTEVEFELEGLSSFGFDVEWELENTLTNEVIEIEGPDTIGEYSFTLDLDDYDAECGYYKLSAIVYTSYDPEGDEDECPDTTSIFIDFACQPDAEAGDDANLCDAVCYYSLQGSYGGVLLSPTHAWSWVEISSPPDIDLVFDDPDDLVTSVCAVDQVDDCPYGEFQAAFQIQNGECYDADTVTLRFYEQPEADAGVDSAFCNIFSFSLWATPFDYCGAPDVNYWSDHYWSFVPILFDSKATIPYGD